MRFWLVSVLWFSLCFGQQAILVTGGAGYIGSHACKALAEAGYLPVTYDNLEHGRRNAVKWGPLVEGDVSDRQKLVEVMDTYHPVAVFHFAGRISVGESVENPARYYQTNLAGTLQLLGAMNQAGVKLLVFSSTAAVYGTPQEVPMSEAHLLAPLSPYGHSKRMVEQVLADYDAAYGLRSVSLRYFNASGADPQGEIGEAHQPETHLIPIVLDVALGKRPYLTIFGEDYPTPDGSAVRDYIHVTDLADAHVCALSYLLQGGSTTRFNLGTGAGYSVKEIVTAARAVTHRPIHVVSGARRPGDPATLVADPSQANQKLGWHPQYSQLETILGTAWKWHQSLDHR